MKYDIKELKYINLTIYLKSIIKIAYHFIYDIKL